MLIPGRTQNTGQSSQSSQSSQSTSDITLRNAAPGATRATAPALCFTMHGRTRRAVLLGLPTLMLVLSLGTGAAQAGKHPRGQPAKPKQTTEGVVNINTASEEQLELLPGIGPSRSRAIARYRAKRKFKATHELVRIRGIGRKTFRRLRNYLTVTGPTTLTQRPARKQRR